MKMDVSIRPRRGEPSHGDSSAHHVTASSPSLYRTYHSNSDSKDNRQRYRRGSERRARSSWWLCRSPYPLELPPHRDVLQQPSILRCCSLWPVAGCDDRVRVPLSVRLLFGLALGRRTVWQSLRATLPKTWIFWPPEPPELKAGSLSLLVQSLASLAAVCSIPHCFATHFRH